MRLPEFSGLGICSLLICAFAKIAQDKWANVSDLLRSLRTNERLWGNCLDRSWQMSLMTNEWMWAIRSGHSGQMSELIGFLSKSITFIFRSQKISDWLKKKIFLIIFFVRFLQYFLKSKRFAHSFWAQWANRSGRSWQMRECERFAQVAQDKWANRSVFWANRSCSLLLTKNVQFLKKIEKIVFWYVFTFFGSFFLKCSFLLSEVSESLRLLRTNEQPQAICSGRSEGMSDREQIAQVSNQKMSKWANHSLFEQIAHLLTFLAKNERFAPKFDERIPNPVNLRVLEICLYHTHH